MAYHPIQKGPRNTSRGCFTARGYVGKALRRKEAQAKKDAARDAARPDNVPTDFWDSWFAAYRKGDELTCHSLVENTLIGKDGGPRIGMATLANSYFQDLADYLVDYMHKELKKCSTKNNKNDLPKSKR